MDKHRHNQRTGGGAHSQLGIYSQKSGALKDSQDEVATLEADLAAAEDEVSSLKVDLAAAQDEVAALEAELAPIDFPDANLEAVIREVFDIPEDPINKFHMETLTLLYCSWADITDLTGLEYCVNLSVL